MERNAIPDIVVGRMPIYLRALQRMGEEGRHVTSSQELGERLGISAAQIRKDLSQFGEFGKQGTGYTIKFLAEQIETILKVGRVWDMAVIGVGDIGRALARYQGFADRGFRVSMIFDIDQAKVGTEIGPFKVRHSSEIIPEIQKANIKVAMIAVPAAAAQQVSVDLVKGRFKRS